MQECRALRFRECGDKSVKIMVLRTVELQFYTLELCSSFLMLKINKMQQLSDLYESNSEDSNIPDKVTWMFTHCFQRDTENMFLCSFNWYKDFW